MSFLAEPLLKKLAPRSDRAKGRRMADRADPAQPEPTAEPDADGGGDSFDTEAFAPAVFPAAAGVAAAAAAAAAAAGDSGSDRAESISPLSSVPSSMRASPHFTPPTPRTPLATPTAEAAGQFQGLDVEALAAALQRSAGRDGRQSTPAANEKQEALVAALTDMGFEAAQARKALEQSVPPVPPPNQPANLTPGLCRVSRMLANSMRTQCIVWQPSHGRAGAGWRPRWSGSWHLATSRSRHRLHFKGTPQVS